jgi:hypothetical protein
MFGKDKVPKILTGSRDVFLVRHMRCVDKDMFVTGLGEHLNPSIIRLLNWIK